MASIGAEEIPGPHSLLFHPHLTWKEKMICPIINSILGAKSLKGLETGTQAEKDSVAKQQKMMKGIESPAMIRPVLQRWETIADCKLAESSGKIPFRKNILKEWGIVDNKTALPDAAINNDRVSVGVLVRFPSSLLPAEELKDLTLLEGSGCYEVDFDTIDWKTFAPDVPVLVQFHGGGYIIGVNGDPGLIEEAVRLLEATPDDVSKDMITISVDYALAPNEPFPLGVMCALSVLDFLCKTRNAIHVTGQSAGAGMALVSGLEGFRKHPRKIKSIQAQGPFIDPSGDGLGYWTNQNVYPDVRWLRFAWRAYLGMENPPKDNEAQNATSDLQKVLRKGSNYLAYQNWKQKHPSKSLQRLVDPTVDLPSGLNGNKNKNAPTIIVRYNRGDPLHAEGAMLEKALRPLTGDNAGYYESEGLHVDAMGPYDAKAPQEYYTILSKALFGVKAPSEQALAQ